MSTASVLLLTADGQVLQDFARAAAEVGVRLLAGHPDAPVAADAHCTLLILDVDLAPGRVQALVEGARQQKAGVPVIGFWRTAHPALAAVMRDAGVERSMMREELLEAAAVILRAVA